MVPGSLVSAASLRCASASCPCRPSASATARPSASRSSEACAAAAVAAASAASRAWSTRICARRAVSSSLRREWASACSARSSPRSRSAAQQGGAGRGGQCKELSELRQSRLCCTAGRGREVGVGQWEELGEVTAGPNPRPLRDLWQGAGQGGCRLPKAESHSVGQCRHRSPRRPLARGRAGCVLHAPGRPGRAL